MDNYRRRPPMEGFSRPGQLGGEAFDEDVVEGHMMDERDDTPGSDLTRRLDDDTEGHKLNTRGIADEDDTEGHKLNTRGIADEDDTEGHKLNTRGVADEDDTEGHKLNTRGVADEDDTEGHALNKRS